MMKAWPVRGWEQVTETGIYPEAKGASKDLSRWMKQAVLPLEKSLWCE